MTLLLYYSTVILLFPVRLMLALTVIGAWSRLRNALQKQFGSTYAWWYTLITVSQYHFMFYMSRPLPNIMVLPLGTFLIHIISNICCFLIIFIDI